MPWSQNYDFLGNPVLSTLLAALPVVVLLGLIAIGHLRIWLAAGLGLGAALAVAIFAIGMPVQPAIAATIYGGLYGLFPIGWIVLNVMFLHALTVKSGRFEALRWSLARWAPDPRVQVVLIAFCFGAFIEGVAGFGTPVAITAAMLMQLGFKPLSASGLSLIANTAPVAFGAVGTPIVTLAQVSGLDVRDLSAMAGRQLPFFSLLVPFWVVAVMSGWQGIRAVWPVPLVAGLTFGVVQFLVSNFHGPWLVDTAAAAASMAAVGVVLKFWRAPKPGTPIVEDVRPPTRDPQVEKLQSSSDAPEHRTNPGNPWVPWAILCVFLFAWGLPSIKQMLDGISAPKFAMPGLHEKVVRTPPVASVPAPGKSIPPEKAEYRLNWLSATGTGILLSALLAGGVMGFGFGELCRAYLATFLKVRSSLVTIAAMLALGNLTKYSGADATMGLAMAKTGAWYPFFGTLLGWLGVALTGSDTASNVLFGSLQRITAEQTGLSPTLMCAANSTGGVMGKMVDAQSIVVAGVATQYNGHEGKILRYVFFHSIALAALVGLLVTLQARVPFFQAMVVPSHHSK